MKLKDITNKQKLSFESRLPVSLERPINIPFLFFFFFVRFIHWGQRKREGGRGAEGKGERESQADSTDSVMSVEPDPRTLRSWPEEKSRVRHSSHSAT